MRVSHRDHRVSRDIARSAWGMVGLVLALGALMLAGPLEAIRFAAVIGLGVAGGVFLWQSSATVGQYVADLESVHRGENVSGRVRVEVTSSVGLDGLGGRPVRATPIVRRRPLAPSEGAGPEPPR